ncbi:MAG: hypothetical protein BWY64_01267 [bacterium ADurb.Bin363]|nr:MAG: hypothetical protein BWY64_01267 [bacterium ADurb.Bin363]
MDEIDEIPDALSTDELEEYILYLNEIMGDYERFINNIGKNGLSAKLMLNYRDEIQEILSLLNHYDLDLSKYWNKLLKLDQILRSKRSTVVQEIGRKNFIMEQIRKEPPKNHWWWYIDRSIPKDPPGFWDFLKKPEW